MGRERADLAESLRSLHLATAVGFVLGALHVNDKLSKYTLRDRTFYRQ